MLISKYKTTSCINGCKLFNDDSNYEYWEDKKVTTDEIEIVKYLNTYIHDKKFSILHIGIGNSYVAKYLNFYKKIDGITVSQNEIKKGLLLNINNYQIYFMNKFEKNIFLKNKLNHYDIIIDVNLKSFSCCEESFFDLINNYYKILNHNGILITSKKGMKWSRIIKPVYAFSIKKLLYKKLKEFNGPTSNILTMNDCKDLCSKYKMKINFENQHLVNFIKNE